MYNRYGYRSKEALLFSSLGRTIRTQLPSGEDSLLRPREKADG